MPQTKYNSWKQAWIRTEATNNKSHPFLPTGSPKIALQRIYKLMVQHPHTTKFLQSVNSLKKKSTLDCRNKIFKTIFI